MTIHIVSSDETVEHEVYKLDKLFLKQGVMISDKLYDGISTNFGNYGVSLRIEGMVVGAMSGIRLQGHASSGMSSHDVYIGSTGSVVGLGEPVTGLYETGIYMKGWGNTVNNYGQISVLGFGNSAIVQEGDDTLIQNFGSIDGDIGILLHPNGGMSTITNDGVISSQRHGVLVEMGDGVLAEMGGVTLVNTGLISNTPPSDVLTVGTPSAITIEDGGDSASNITNAGTIIGDIIGPQDQVLNLANSGQIIGDVHLGGQADVYDGRGGKVSGVVYGGAGDDVYMIDNALIRFHEAARGGEDTVVSAASYALEANFEKLSLVGSANINGTGNSQQNTLVGNAGNNVLRGGDGRDVLKGGLGDDKLRGQGGNDIIIGANGDDILRGGSGNDRLNGGNGDDVLIGGAGRDELTGRGGDDVFVFHRAKHSPNSSEADKIADFELGHDRIDLSTVGTHSLTFSTETAFNGSGWGEVKIGILVGARGGSYSEVQVDSNGDGVQDMSIIVSDVIGLGYTDFIL